MPASSRSGCSRGATEDPANLVYQSVLTVVEWPHENASTRPRRCPRSVRARRHTGIRAARLSEHRRRRHRPRAYQRDRRGCPDAFLDGSGWKSHPAREDHDGPVSGDLCASAETGQLRRHGRIDRESHWLQRARFRRERRQLESGGPDVGAWTTVAERPGISRGAGQCSS